MNNDKIKALLSMGTQAEDIMHGQLKIDMLEAEQDYLEKKAIEDDHDWSDAEELTHTAYAEGFLDGLAAAYQYTYDISFARAELEKENA